MKELPKKTLVIIGNGFDLAHGLKTSYNDFFKDYILKKSFEAYQNKINRQTEDELFRISCPLKIHNFKDYIKNLEDEDLSLNDVLYRLEGYIEVIPLTDFAKKIYTSFNKWVDIENTYFELLKKTILDYESITIKRNDSLNQLKQKLLNLNIQMDLLTQELKKYLSIASKNYRKIPTIDYEFFLSHYKEYFPDLTMGKINSYGHFIHILDFNYTSTTKSYKKSEHPNIKIDLNKIHGNLNDSKNPIIFGFGDERDNSYQSLEDINLDEALKKIKSFSYFKTQNYSNFLDFIDGSEFTVVIVGHSCGLSDRVLLSTIFEHKNCKKIRICFYEDLKGKNDYTSKTYQISRHFQDKGKMRERIIPFNVYDRIPQL